MISVSALILSIFITIILIPIFSRLALRFGAIDMPDPRKIHALPIPRIAPVSIPGNAIGKTIL